MPEEATLRIIETEEVIAGVKWRARVEASWTEEDSSLVEFEDPNSADDEKLITWFLEDYPVSDPFNAGKATKARNTLRQYGRQLYDTIFGGPIPKIESILLIVVSSSGKSQFQSLHWELIEDHFRDSSCRVTVIREVAARLPCLPFQQTNRLRILVACARPATRENANPPYRTITEPLFNNIQQSGLPIEMDIIRPGTWRALKSHLRRSREEGVRYDVVHFDLHGTISREKKAELLFCTPGNRKDPIEASDIAKEIRGANIPVAILNSCNSATERDGSNNLAREFISEGISLVVAMSYKVTAKAAAQFTTQLYASLMSGEDIHGSVFSARNILYKDKERRGRFGNPVSLEDWVVPVIYKSHGFGPPSFSFLSPEKYKPVIATRPTLYGCDEDILEIETRLTWQPFMLLQGMLGAGKSHLLRYLSQWWRSTGFVKNVVFIDFGEGIKTDGQICRSIVSVLSPNMSLNTDTEYQAAALRLLVDNAYTLLILDNINSTRTTDANQVLQRAIATGLDNLLWKIKGLENSNTFVVLASRSSELWNSSKTRNPVYGKNVHKLGGLDNLSASEFAATVLRQDTPKNNGYYELLISLLKGNPLALQTVVPAVSLDDLGPFFLACVMGIEQEQHLRSLAPFSVLPDSRDTVLQQDLQCFAYVNGDCQRQYLEYSIPDTDGHHLDNFIRKVAELGLILPDKDYFEIHPLLPIQLRRTLSDTIRRTVGSKFVAYVVQRAQTTTLKSLEQVHEIADSVTLKLFTAWTLAVAYKDDASRRTLFNALATIHYSVLRRPLYLEDFTEQLIRNEGWLRSTQLPLQGSIRCLFMAGNLCNMKHVRSDLEATTLWATRFLEVGERPTTIPEMPFLKFAGPLSPSFLPKLKEVEFIFKRIQPYLYPLYALAAQVAMKLGDYQKMIFFDTQKKAVDLPLLLDPIITMESQIMTDLISRTQTLSIMAGKLKDSSANTDRSVSSGTDTSNLPKAFLGTQRSQTLQPELMAGFSHLSRYFETPESQLASREAHLVEAKTKFQKALEISHRSAKTAPLFYIYRCMATIAYVQSDWEQVELYIARFENEMENSGFRDGRGTLDKVFGVSMKMYKADARLYLGKIDEALDIYASIGADLGKLKEDGACWEYVGDPFHSVKKEIRKGNTELLGQLKTRAGLVDTISMDYCNLQSSATGKANVE